ncbi:uncharacterized protein [Choristoneura fumiferana]|uniref:uncharacterized protein n=1 Tax=Choristoneura fumiferana TaxID=7141 RepID=UPI003D1589B4
MTESEKVSLAQLVVARGHAKGSITRLLNYSGELSNKPLTELKIKRDRLIHVFQNFESLQVQIDVIEPDDQLAGVEDTYCLILQRLDDAIAAHHSSGVAPSSSAIGPSVRTKLPNIEIPKFDGKYKDYQTFIALYDSMIANNSEIDNVHKLYYLRTLLEGEPLKLIENLSLSSESYTAAKNILNDRYNNKFQIMAEHINSLLDSNPITRSTPSNIREFVSGIKQRIAALQNLGLPVESWDVILVIILCKKLDLLTNRAFQLERDAKAEPKLSELIQFLEKRALALELAEPAIAAPKVQFERPAMNSRPTWKAATVAAAPMAEPDLAASSEMEHTARPGSATASEKPCAFSKVKLICQNGKEIQVRALLDTGSQVSFITDNTLKILGYIPVRNETSIIGITHAENKTHFSVRLEVHSNAYPFSLPVECHVVDKITMNLPQNMIDMTTLNLPPSLKLADDTFNAPGDIQMLMGADIFFQILLPTQTEPPRQPASEQDLEKNISPH